MSHGLRLSDGEFTSFDVPGATITFATGINPRGHIVGRYIDPNGVSHAFLLSDDQFSTIDFPDATFTGATAISPRGDILGRYSDADGVRHGFLLSRRYETTTR